MHKFKFFIRVDIKFLTVGLARAGWKWNLAIGPEKTEYPILGIKKYL